MPWIVWYHVAVNALACVLTIWDKHCARRGKWRVSERTLFTLAALGGAAAMLIMMHVVRHKTKHRRFMWGLPLIIVVQVAALLAWMKFT